MFFSAVRKAITARGDRVTPEQQLTSRERLTLVAVGSCVLAATAIVAITAVVVQ